MCMHGIHTYKYTWYTYIIDIYIYNTTYTYMCVCIYMWVNNNRLNQGNLLQYGLSLLPLLV